MNRGSERSRSVLPCRFVLASICFAFILTPFAHAEDFSGRVVGLTDGDTIKVLHNGRAERIRLNGIDFQEKGQQFGTKAKQFTSEMVFGKTVTVHVKNTD